MTVSGARSYGSEPGTAVFSPSVCVLPVSGRGIALEAENAPATGRAPERVGEPELRPDIAEISVDKSYPFPVWSGILTRRHRAAIGISVWTFLWFLDRVTAEKYGWGIVLGGKPVKDREIARCLGVHENSVRRDRRALLSGRYIECTRTPYGFTYRVRNSRKFGVWGKKRVTRSCDSEERESQEVVTPESQEVVNVDQTMQLDHAVTPTPFEGGFEVFWKAYPRKDAKKAAERTWRKIPVAEVPKILAAVRAWNQTDQWLKESGRYVPYASTFLNQERWNDPLPDKAEQPGRRYAAGPRRPPKEVYEGRMPAGR